jgi:hypothetical protein
MDGVENESWRGVIISVWNKPNLPPPPPPPLPQPRPQLDPVERKFFKRWLGFGVKSGGQLLIGGVEHYCVRRELRRFGDLISDY